MIPNSLKLESLNDIKQEDIDDFLIMTKGLEIMNDLYHGRFDPKNGEILSVKGFFHGAHEPPSTVKYEMEFSSIDHLIELFETNLPTVRGALTFSIIIKKDDLEYIISTVGEKFLVLDPSRPKNYRNIIISYFRRDGYYGRTKLFTVNFSESKILVSKSAS